ncbi:MAG: HNH endonuclease [Bacteriovorax sp.]|nr:HNH endonuclease [Bacteriovorax sp.]
MFLIFLTLWLITKFYNFFIYPIIQIFKSKNEFGYILTSQGFYEHREKVQTLIGRKLNSNEEVHHINGKKWDNKKSNLALLTRENHQRWHKHLHFLYSKKKYPKIKSQRKILVKEFEARIF